MKPVNQEDFFRPQMVPKALLSNCTFFKDVGRIIKTQKMWQEHNFW